MLAGLSPHYIEWMLSAWAALAAYFIAVLLIRPWRSSRRPIRILFKWSFSLWILALAAVAAETLFVGCYSTTDAFSLSLISKRWYDRYVEKNNWNCRDRRRYEGPIPPGMKRLAIVGDSFAFGHGIKNPKDRFGDLLERDLNLESNQRWEVYNLAEPGAGTGWEVDRLHELARKENFRADVMLLAYCLNDLEDLVPETYEIVGGIINDPPKNFLCREFFLPNFLYYRMNHFRRPEVRGYFGWLKDGYKGEIWARQCARLDEIKKWCDDRNTKLAVVVFPFMVGLDGGYAFSDAHRALAAYFERAGIPFIDLDNVYTDFASHGVSLVVNAFDAHPNERAHQLAEKEILRLLRPHLIP